jgi:hypothetical protein
MKIMQTEEPPELRHETRPEISIVINTVTCQLRVLE